MTEELTLFDVRLVAWISGKCYSPLMSTPSVQVSFAYEHRYRAVNVERVWQSSAGAWLITGYDLDREEYRTFQVDRIRGKIHILKGDHEETSHPSLPADT